jgi:hypothetical protein
MPPTNAGVLEMDDSPKMSVMYAITGSQRNRAWGSKRFGGLAGFDGVENFGRTLL